MEILFHILFGGSLFLIVYTYIIYPFLVKFLARNKSPNQIRFTDNEEWPKVSVLISAYNEEDVIKQKIESLLAQDYAGELNIYIGSDKSDDNTNDIVFEFSEQYAMINFYPFDKRRGKPSVINNLNSIICDKHDQSENHIYVITDANVILSPNVISALVSHFKNTKIGLVDSNMIYTGLSKEGISKSEDTYLSKEVLLKRNEGLVWKNMIGPFGGCYAFRSNYFKRIPENYLVDDFYMAMNIFEQGGLAINTLDAKCYEPVSHKLSQEFKRKKRISAGNFQNLFRFKKLLNPFSSLGFALISHKVLRWMGPFFISIICLSALYFSMKGVVSYQIILVLLFVWFVCIPFIDFLFSKLKIHWHGLRSISYFNLMNVALLAGFFKYLGGIQKGTWDRTERVLENLNK